MHTSPSVAKGSFVFFLDPYTFCTSDLQGYIALDANIRFCLSTSPFPLGTYREEGNHVLAANMPHMRTFFNMPMLNILQQPL